MALWATGALVAAVPAVAAEPDWTYAQLAYLRADSGDDATDGFRLDGSLAFADMFHVQAGYVDASLGVTGGEDIDFDGYRFAVGVHPMVGENTHAVADIQYFDYSYDGTAGNPDNDVDGVGVGVGLRHMLTDEVEVNGMAWWNEGSEDDAISPGTDEDFSDISLEIGGRYRFNENLSAGVTVTTNDSLAGGDSAKIDLRYSFADL
jgi:hypothetical protein